MTHHHHHPDREPWHDLPAAFIDRLELESRLNESMRRETLEQAALALRTPPSTIIDIGSGTGSDAVALAEYFPTARIHALDVSAALLERVESTAAASGLADQIVGHRVDLNDDWSKEAPQGVDLAWASLSLHHLSDPAAALKRVFTTLKPGGVFVLTELTGPGTFTPSDLGSGRTSLQESMTHGLSAHSAHGTRDWSKLLEQAGFTAVEYQEKEFSARADTIDGARYLEMQLRSQRERLTSDLSAENLAVIDAAINAVKTGKSEISFSAGRGVWIAARP
ncbi:class I SAM-dependent methyltransferase [Corynebacterium hylobatis]|uniref:Class I SAM-dependent methyltransferase n=1 Tax=Corynebacterium hylobatis TaxID=1859290 RepID=A0A3R9ZZ13_9CORY|nr:class I SAM-dependent methyltransferase [Corynebacterium hylobatis]RSZ62176.1 class I SAM-dependent methyltransferase [Corynebacterium hylobatis]